MLLIYYRLYMYRDSDGRCMDQLCAGRGLSGTITDINEQIAKYENYGYRLIRVTLSQDRIKLGDV